MMFRVVCVCVIQVLLAVQAYPTISDADAPSVSSQEPVLVAGMTEVSGVVPASGSVTVLGNSACHPLLHPNQVFMENVEPFTISDEYSLPSIDLSAYESDIYAGSDLMPVLQPSSHFENSNMDDISKKVLLGSIIADSIIAGNEAEIEAKLDEIDSFVASELEIAESIINTVLENTAIPVIDALINSHLSESQSEIAIMEAMVESELQKVDKMIESVLENATTVHQVKQVATKLLTDLHIAPSENHISSYAERNAKLDELDLIIELEFEKINSFIDSELAKVDAFIELELAKVDSFVESKLAITRGLMDAKLKEMKSYVDSKLAKIEALIEPKITLESEPEVMGMPVQGVAKFSGNFPATGKAFLFGNTGYPTNYDNTAAVPGREPVIAYDRVKVPEFNHSDDIPETIVVRELSFSGVVPAIGSTRIVGNFGCPPLFPSNPPIVGNAGPFVHNNVYSFSNYANSLPTREDGLLSRVHNLPAVNLKHDNVGVNNVDGLTKDAVVERDLKFSGKTEATGSAKVFAHFGCAPLFPTEETPDGRKHIWVSKKPRNSVIPPPPKQHIHQGATFPVMPTFPTDFPETVIMDSSKNYERFIDNDATLDHQDVPVVGDLFFEGVVPAFGSVSLTGHCA